VHCFSHEASLPAVALRCRETIRYFLPRHGLPRLFYSVSLSSEGYCRF